MGITTRALAQPKALVGDAAWSVANLTQVSQVMGQRSQQKLMADGQALFHTNPWVGAVERAIVGAFLRLPWHVENDGETIGPEQRRADGRLDAAMRLLESPSSQYPHNTFDRLSGITLRHQGLCGIGFWHLDQREFLTGIPLEILYINPVRMESVSDEAGNLLGWLLDGPRNPVSGRVGHPGVPLSTDEVIPILLDPPDTGHFGVGIPESAQRKIELSRLADNHIAQLLSSGGRLAGIMAPKQGEQMQADQWDAVLRGWRQIANDPDGAKRLHIVKGAVDFTPTTMKPADMELNDLSRMGRDDILALWGLPPSQRGITEARGMNSGETQKYEEAALYQGPVQERGDRFVEAVQLGLLNRFRAIGLNLKLVIDWPSFDDQAPLFENAQRAKVVPMTVNDRRESVGLDPLDPTLYGDLGTAIFIDQTMVRIDAAPAVPETPSTPPTPKMTEGEAQDIVEAKAALESFATLGERLRTSTQPGMRSAVRELLDRQRDAIAALVEERAELIARKPNDHTLWWVPSRWSWADTVAPVLGELAERTVTGVRSGLAPSKADPLDFIEGVKSHLAAHLLERARGIDTTTRQQVAAILSQGVTEGAGPGELATRIRNATTFDDARAEVIARTETAIAQNAATLRTYGSFDVAEVQAIDGDTDAECAARNGRVFALSDAEGISDHPNGTLDWIPVVPELAPAKAILPDVRMAHPTDGMHFHMHVPDTLRVPVPVVTVNVPDFPTIPAPVVNLPAPVVNVPETVVNVPAPVVNVAAPPKATGPQEVVVVSMPDRVHRAIREGGKITGSVETDA